MKTTTTDENGSFTIQLDPGVISLLIYSDDPSTPGFDYLPAMINAAAGKVVSVALEPAASLSFKGNVLFVDTENIPTSYSYQVLDEDGALFSSTGFPLSFSSKTSIQIPNLSATTVIVPAGISYRLWFGVSILVGTKVITRAMTSDVQQPLAQGTITDFNATGPILDYNLSLVETTISEVSPRIEVMEGQGFYLASEKGKLASAEASYNQARQLYNSGRYSEGFDAAKRSYIDASNTLSDLYNLYFDATSSVYILIGFLAVASVTSAFLLVDSKRLQISLGAGLYISALLVLNRVYPGTAATPILGFLFAAGVSYIGVVTAAVLLPKLLGGVAGDDRVSLSGVLIPIFSIAKRSLKRRRLRFILTLISLTVLVMSFVALTSLSQGYGLMITKSSGVGDYKGIIIRASTWTDANPTFIISASSEASWLSNQPEVKGISVKVENVPQQIPITSISGNKIYSIIGVNAVNETQIIPLASTLTQGVLPSPGDVALSITALREQGLSLVTR